MIMWDFMWIVQWLCVYVYLICTSFWGHFFIIVVMWHIVYHFTVLTFLKCFKMPFSSLRYDKLLGENFKLEVLYILFNLSMLLHITSKGFGMLYFFISTCCVRAFIFLDQRICIFRRRKNTPIYTYKKIPCSTQNKL